ncbi:MAG: S1 RNA-binding domain-containing protein [Acholeplasmatales bacterium]|jgi:uncharacterized protein|nr:S1 RNA-binding domain-containing protein [Acholeplasmatales bacterium]
MNEAITLALAKKLNIKTSQVLAVLKLLEEGGTIPFIARYRKEVTGGLDENIIQEIKKDYDYEANLLARKEAVINLIDEKGLLTEELRNSILAATKLVEVEDLYRPFKEKKQTKATDAIARGLEPLAKWMLTFPHTSLDEEAKKYVTGELEDHKKEVLSVADAITGAKYIISEMISDVAQYRKDLRELINKHGVIVTKEKKGASELDPKKTYLMYYDRSESVSAIKPHRVLAVNRAEAEKVITCKIETPVELLISYLYGKVVVDESSTCTKAIKEATDDSLARLIYPSIEREIRSELTDHAQEQAIILFGENLYRLLLQPPMKGKVVLGVDPAFRTGCKICVIDEQGKRLHKDKIYPNEKSKGTEVDELTLKKSKDVIENLVRKFKVELIAIGNGTASRETESFIVDTIKERHLEAKYVIVSEAGASVYSAGDIAQKEFPDDSIEERSAASIARRLQDPLSELVKIDPKSIGVGQYQYDVNQKELNERLDFIVTQGVNKVGVDINTASEYLLTFISGLNKKVAENIVKYRDDNGAFASRPDLLKVPGFKEKTYEQAIGFLRITGGKEALDASSIHPESYVQARALMDKLNINPSMFGKPEIKELLSNVKVEELSKELNINNFLLHDILEAFIAPQRDPRDEFPQPILKSDILDIKDLFVGMKLQGTVRNVVDFGAFVDIGLHADGLIHLSKMSRTKIKHPMDAVSVGDIVDVYVYEVDLPREKVQLSLLPLDEEKTIEERVKEHKQEKKVTKVAIEEREVRVPNINPGIDIHKLSFGDKVKGVVVKIDPKGYAFVNIGLNSNGFLHISNITKTRNKPIEEYLKEGQEIEAYIYEVDAKANKVTLSILDPLDLF